MAAAGHLLYGARGEEGMKEIKRIEDLRPDGKNANKGTERGLAILEDSLRKYGAGRSILVDKDGEVIAGNKTLEVAADLGLPIRVVKTNGSELVVVQREDLDLDDGSAARELAYADNRSSQVGLDWDLERILVDVNEGVDLSGLWGEQELNELLKGLQEPPADPGPQIDRAEELREKWQTERGQIWEIGRHRLMCGDSTSEEDVGRLMVGGKADLLWTDPPYHVGKQFGSYDEGMKWDALMQTAWLENAKAVLGPSAQRYICFAPARSRDAILAYEPKRLLVWCKPFALMRSNSWDWAYEFVAWCFEGDGPVYFDKPMGRASFDWQEIASVIHGQEGKHHITQKPLGLCSRHIEASTPMGDTVLDLFLGSGTTMVAAEQLGRVCFGMEISPAYVAVTLERMAGMGLEPKLAESAKVANG